MDIPDNDLPTPDDEPTPNAVFVSTGVPVQLSIAPMDDARAPEGTCLASYIDGRLIARCAMPREAVDRLVALKLFDEPVPLGLLAFEEEPGLQCRLIALVPTEALAENEVEDEPWKASVPSYEASLSEEQEDDEEAALAPILLGNIVRFTRDRKFPDDLTQEAVDVLVRIVSGDPLGDANARAVDDLLDSL